MNELTTDLAPAEMTPAEAQALNERIHEATKALQPTDVAAIFKEVAEMSDWNVKKELLRYRKSGHA